MDLVATVTKKDSVDVWRLNGQRVFGANFAKDEDEDGEDGGLTKTEGNVRGVAWKSDGEFRPSHSPALHSIDRADGRGQS